MQSQIISALEMFIIALFIQKDQVSESTSKTNTDTAGERNDKSEEASERNYEANSVQSLNKRRLSWQKKLV
jgi:hypothetical protein